MTMLWISLAIVAISLWALGVLTTLAIARRNPMTLAHNIAVDGVRLILLVVYLTALVAVAVLV